MKTSSILVLAYGSNLSTEQMLARCPTARAECTATLPHHALAFGGYSARWRAGVANVVPAAGQHVMGMLYRLEAPDLEALDVCEGHPYIYERRAKIVLDAAGRRRRAQVYIQCPEEFSLWAPSTTYLQTIARAYDRLGFCFESLHRAAEEATATLASESEEEALRVFVYGTLLSGETNHRLLKSARRLGAARTLPLFRLHDLGAFPALTRGGFNAAVGEVYEVDASTLAELDRLEGHPSHYQRTSIILENGTAAETYLMGAARVTGRPVIASGDWRKFRRGIRDLPRESAG